MADQEVLKPRLQRLGYRLTGAPTMPPRCRWQVARYGKAWWFSSLEAVERFADGLPELPPQGFVE